VQCDGANNIVVWPFNTKQDPDAGRVGLGAAIFQHQRAEFRLVSRRHAGLALRHQWRRRPADDRGGRRSPSVINALSPNVVQQAGVQVIPPGAEMPYAGITAPTGWYFEDGSAKSRTTDAPLFNAITATCTGNTHNNTTVDNLSVDLRSLGLEGAFIEGTGISLGTTITSINSATSLTLSQAASGTNSVTLRILPMGQGDGSTTFNIPDRRGVTIAGRDNMGGSVKAG
jgi:microcystin-dependent protein